MGIESDQLVYDYLSRVGDLAQRRHLPSGDRMRLVSSLREEIDKQRAKTTNETPATVRRVLARFGTPEKVVEAATGSPGAGPLGAGADAPDAGVDADAGAGSGWGLGRGRGTGKPGSRGPGDGADVGASGSGTGSGSGSGRGWGMGKPGSRGSGSGAGGDAGAGGSEAGAGAGSGWGLGRGWGTGKSGSRGSGSGAGGDVGAGGASKAGPGSGGGAGADAGAAEPVSGVGSGSGSGAGAGLGGNSEPGSGVGNRHGSGSRSEGASRFASGRARFASGGSDGPGGGDAAGPSVPVQRDRLFPGRNKRVPRPRRTDETPPVVPAPPHLAGLDELGTQGVEPDWWRLGPAEPLGGDFVPGFVGGVEIPEILKPPPVDEEEAGDEARDEEAGAGASEEDIGVEVAPRRRLLPRPGRRREGGARPGPRNPLLLLAAALLVAGALFGLWLALGAGWLLAYASRRLSRAESKWAVFGMPGLTLLGGLVWLWGRQNGRWGTPIAEGAMGDALTGMWPWLIRIAAVSSAAFLVWRARRAGA